MYKVKNFAVSEETDSLVNDLIDQGIAKASIVETLIGEGYTTEAAATITNHIIQERMSAAYDKYL